MLKEKDQWTVNVSVCARSQSTYSHILRMSRDLLGKFWANPAQAFAAGSCSLAFLLLPCSSFCTAHDSSATAQKPSQTRLSHMAENVTLLRRLSNNQEFI